jgi:hypothetical protein
MSLTSYRAAPPRVVFCFLSVCFPVYFRFLVRFCLFFCGEGTFWIDIFGWPGSDLLSRVLRHSTIGAGEFNGRVRDGIGFGLPARATGPAKDIFWHLFGAFRVRQAYRGLVCCLF